MKLLFNKNSSGDTEIKAILGFLDGGFKFANIETDVKLNTPYLIDFISEAVYNKIEAYYSAENPTEDEILQQAIEYVQIYILSKAYLDYVANNDLSHGTDGRSFRSEQDQKLPWEWQLLKDEASIAKRAYKALDLLFLLLEKSEWSEWTNSDAYKTANKLFLKNTKLFDKAFPIEKSGQLYYRLVSFMEDFETDMILPLISPAKATELKEVETPNDEQKALLSLIYKAVAYLALGKAMKALPVEMFPKGLMYNENTRMKSQARAEVMLFLNAEGEKYVSKLEHEYNRQNQTFETLKTTNGLEEGKKYVNL